MRDKFRVQADLLPKWLHRISLEVEDVLMPTIIAYELAIGGSIDFYGPKNPDHIMYRIVAHPAVFFIRIRPVRHYWFWYRFCVDFEFNNGSFLVTHKRFALKELPVAFSEAFQSAVDGPIQKFKSSLNLK